MKHIVQCGVDRTETLRQIIGGRRTALLTAASGVNKQGIPTFAVVASMSRLLTLFAPEHGLASAMQDGLFGNDDGAIHPETGAHLYNLTPTGHPRLEELVREVDVAIYDIQDVGARFYTYLCNLTQLMRACAAAGTKVLVLDRPNPIGNTRAEGPILDESRFSSFIGEYAVPTRYGLTVGEYARWANEEKGIGCDLEVLPCVGWTPELYYDDTDLLFVNPSPNIPSVNTAFNYIGSCIYEATNISEGRGTTRPFDYIGAPFVDAGRLLEEMNGYHLDGVVFRKLDFTPQFDKYRGEICHGVELHVTDREAYRPIETMLYMFRHFKGYPEFSGKASGLALRFGQDVLLDDYDPAALLREAEVGCRIFSEKVRKYRLY